MATWPSTLPSPQKNIGIVPGDTRINRRLQSGRTEFRRFGDGKPDQMKALFRLTWAEWAIFKEFHANQLNLGVNWFSADWLADVGYDAHKARILGYPREVALQNYYVDVLCNFIVQATANIVTEDTVWPCEPTGTEPGPLPPSDNGYVYGGDSTGEQILCNGYNPDINTWTSKTNMPLPSRDQHAASTIGSSGYIYCGGYSYIRLRDCDEYTPDTWISKADCPLYERNELSATTVGSKGYIFGGDDNFVDCDEYTPDTNSWASKADCLHAGTKSSAFSIGASSYVCVNTKCSEYLASTDTWTSKAPSPLRDLSAASTIGSAGYLYGGWVYLNSCDQYIPIGDSWTSKPDFPGLGRHEHAASTIGSSGYIYGGYCHSMGPVKYCVKYTPDTWVAISDLLINLYQHAASTI